MNNNKQHARIYQIIQQYTAQTNDTNNQDSIDSSLIASCPQCKSPPSTLFPVQTSSIHPPFTPHFITSSSSSASSSPNLYIRYLELSDYNKGIFPLLSQLTVCPPLTFSAYHSRYHLLFPPHFHVLVVEDVSCGRVVGMATLLLEFKLLRGAGLVAHVEDVVVDSKYRGQKLGDILVRELNNIARHYQCYKIILDCDEKNVKFYQKLGYSRNSTHMAMYLSATPKPTT